MISLKAVIFDYGKVLALPQTDEAMAAMAHVAGMPADVMHDRYWRDRAAFDRGDLTIEDYWRGVSPGLTDEQIREIIRIDNESWVHADPPMIRWAEALHAGGIRTGVLSNMPVTLRRYLAVGVPWLRGFDHYTFSCDVNLVKPEEAIYRHSLAGLGVTPGEALFLDDRMENVEGARRAGMHALLFRTAAELDAEIAGVFALPRVDAGSGS